MSDQNKLSPETYRALRAAGKLDWQQQQAVIHTSAEQQREAMRAKRQQHEQSQQHARKVKQVAESQLANLRAQHINSPESILAMQKERQEELKRSGNKDRARLYGNLIADQQKKVDEANAAKEFENSDDFKIATDIVGNVRPLIEKFLPEALANVDAAIEVFKQTRNSDLLFQTVSRISTQATSVEARTRAESKAKLAEQTKLVSDLSAEQLAANKINDLAIEAAAKLSAAAGEPSNGTTE